MGRRTGSAALTIRPSEEGDAERIRRILGVAFADENRRMGLKQTRLPTMSDELLSFYMTRSRDHSFVAAGRGGIVGFCLACRWGSTAWLGPIAVLPPVQGEGLGRRLVETSEASLRAAGVTTLGLETMPRSYRNLQFYSRLGMRFEQMTLDVSRSFTADPAGAAALFAGPSKITVEPLGPLPPADRREGFEQVALLSDAVSPGLDYRGEAELTLASGLGEVLMARRDRETIGFVIVHVRPYAREEKEGAVRLNTLLMLPEAAGDSRDGALAGLLDSVGRWLIGAGCDALIVRVPTRFPAARDILLERGFAITHSDVRLTWPDLPERVQAGAVHLCKWE